MYRISECQSWKSKGGQLVQILQPTVQTRKQTLVVQPADTDNRKEQAKKPFVGGEGAPPLSHTTLCPP